MWAADRRPEQGKITNWRRGGSMNGYKIGSQVIRSDNMRSITLEEHYATPAFLKGPGRELRERTHTAGGLVDGLVDALLDLGAGRIARMDEAGIEMQVLSLTAPGIERSQVGEATALSRDANDYVADAVRRYPSRFAGFAALPTPNPSAAAKELERCIGVGFKGAVINGHISGRYLDNQIFWPIFESAEALGAPIYLHPAQPPQTVIDTYYGGFSKDVTFMFANAGFGWHIETAIHALRMILGGVFDRFPKLQLILGHLGEALPFMIQRLDNMRPPMTGLKRPISAYLRENFHYTFSGFNFTPAFLTLLLEMGAERIMFSADYPYASMTAARSFLDRLPVSPSDREKIAHGNAESILRI
jgi:predicted TIM-barrel fold metal-dependent hydrolase